MSLPAFSEINEKLEQAHSMIGAAETHGLICGFLCGGKQTNGKNWLEPIFGLAEIESTEQMRHILLDLYNKTHIEINHEEFGFQLLIPKDEQPLESRAKSLSSWCQGFLTGIGLTGAYIDEEDTEETQEILYRFDDISKLDYENIEVRPEDERAFVELYEYVRMAVLVVYNELTDARPSGLSNAGKLLH